MNVGGIAESIYGDENVRLIYSGKMVDGSMGMEVSEQSMEVKW